MATAEAAPVPDIEPMLAKDHSKVSARTMERIWDDTGWVAEPKLDGERALMHVTNNGVYFTGRRVSDVTGHMSNKSTQIPHLTRPEAYEYVSPAIFDGELVLETNPAITGKPSTNIEEFSNLTRILGSDPDRAIDLQENDFGMVHYVVFDCLQFGDSIDYLEGGLLHNRQALAQYAVKEYVHRGLEFIHFIDRCNGSSRGISKQEYLNKILRMGGEGVMLKDRQSVYHPGKRRQDWIKVKKSLTFDAFITGFAMGKGEYNKEEIGTIRFGTLVKRNTFRTLPRIRSQIQTAPEPEGYEVVDWGTCRGMTYAQILEMTTNAMSFVGRTIEVKCNGVFPDGKLRHPQFLRMRPDITWRDCRFDPEDY